MQQQASMRAPAAQAAVAARAARLLWQGNAEYHHRHLKLQLFSKRRLKLISSLEFTVDEVVHKTAVPQWQPLLQGDFIHRTRA